MESVIINIPTSSLTQSGEFYLEFNDKDRLLGLIANAATNLIQTCIFDVYNIDVHSKFPITAEGILAMSNSSIAPFPSVKRDYAFNVSRGYFGKLQDSYSSISFSSYTTQDQKNSSRFESLLQAFNEEVKRYGHYILVGNNEAFLLFKEVAKQLARINFKDCAVELTPSNSFKLKLLLPDGKLLVVTRPFSEIDDLNKDEVIFGLFENKKCLISDAKSIVELVKGINDYLDSK